MKELLEILKKLNSWQVYTLSILVVVAYFGLQFYKAHNEAKWYDNPNKPTATYGETINSDGFKTKRVAYGIDKETDFTKAKESK